MEQDLCAYISRTNNCDPIGTATQNINAFLFIDVKPPWAHDIHKSEHFPASVFEFVTQYSKASGQSVRLQGLIPNPELAQKRYTRIMYFRKPPGPFCKMDKTAYVIPEDNILGLLDLLLHNSGQLAQYEKYREDHASTRDFFICTHESHDICCGRYGEPLYQSLEQKIDGYRGSGLNIWKTSHLTGHRFAPHVLDLPEGRYWSYLTQEKIDIIIHRDQPPKSLRNNYRGVLDLPFHAQVLEREILILEGWNWTNYYRSSTILAEDKTEEWVKVRIEYFDHYGQKVGFYEGIVEPEGPLQKFTNSRCTPELKSRAYHVKNLKKKR